MSKIRIAKLEEENNKLSKSKENSSTPASTRNLFPVQSPSPSPNTEAKHDEEMTNKLEEFKKFIIVPNMAKRNKRHARSCPFTSQSTLQSLHTASDINLISDDLLGNNR